MIKKLERAFNIFWVKGIVFLLFAVLPAWNSFYKDVVIRIFGGLRVNLEFSEYIFDIFTGFLLGGMFLLYMKSRNEYTRIKAENHRIREMLLTIHTFDNLRFSKIQPIVKDIFHQEEQTLILRLKDVFKKDLGLDYTDDEMNEILDCFYRNKPKFI